VTESWRIPLCDPARWVRDTEPQLEEAVRRVLRSGRFILGEEVEAFEAECARFLGVKHAVGVSSGTDALVVALSSLGIGPGDEVVCPTFTFVATAEAIVHVGATPVFVDSSDGAFHVDPNAVERAITKRTRALVPVHLFAVPAQISKLVEIAARAGVAIVEDCAQCFGIRCAGRALGSFGRLACMSLFPTKLLGGFGDGGLVVTSDDELARVARLVRQHGIDPAKKRSQRIGGNHRLDAIQAAMLRVALGNMDARLASLAAVSRAYDELLGSSVVRPTPLGEVRVPYVVRVPAAIRQRLVDDLGRRGIETNMHYRYPLHLH